MKKIFYALLLLLSLPLIFMLAIRLFALCMLIDIGFSPFSRSTPPAKANAEPAAISLSMAAAAKTARNFCRPKRCCAVVRCQHRSRSICSPNSAPRVVF